MRIGVCCSLDSAPMAVAAGFDYVELPAALVFGGRNEPDWAKLEGLPVEATNIFAPEELRLVGPDVGDVVGYAERMIPLAAKAGVKVMVVGSGASRRSPAGYDLDAAEGDFLDSMSRCARIGREHGITIAPESLRREETNVGNYLGDFARMLHFKEIAYTADSYHVLGQPGAVPAESWFWDEEVPFAPVHVHLSTHDRGWRVAEDAGLSGFAMRLEQLGYDGRVSLECRWADFSAEAPEALEQVRKLLGD
jgi:sugar phosphate isomerase/epimerase